MHVLITAGPTREPIDAVRFVSNRSSGRMGVAIAAAAAAGGHQVTLLVGPGVDLAGVADTCTVIRFESADDLAQRLDEHFSACDVLVMSAAVADYRPRHRVEGKIERSASESLTIEFEPIPDLVAGVAARKKEGQRIVAFALEQPDRLTSRAAAKMKRKRVDAIIANPLATMDAGDVAPVWLTADGRKEALGAMSKADFGRWLIGRIEAGW